MQFPLCFAYLSMGASIIALFTLIIASFQSGDTGKDRSVRFIRRASRTIKTNDSSDKVEKADVNVRVTALLWTVVLGQVIGLFFVLFYVSDADASRTFLRVNGFILIFASLLCSFLTILNGWLKIRMELWYRIIFQAYSFVVGGFLLSGAVGGRISISRAVSEAGEKLYLIIMAFFFTVILALILMFADGVYRDNERLEYDFNNYFRIVITVGMIIGLGLLFIRSIRT
ncbi:hypothetical protein JXB12_13605 [candidate division KSB1 bacterium]|nr:hypothetical protein [candidate division KSB1 bacterium]